MGGGGGCAGLVVAVGIMAIDGVGRARHDVGHDLERRRRRAELSRIDKLTRRREECVECDAQRPRLVLGDGAVGGGGRGVHWRREVQPREVHCCDADLEALCRRRGGRRARRPAVLVAPLRAAAACRYVAAHAVAAARGKRERAGACSASGAAVSL